MSHLEYEVKKGDCLWKLAGNYLKDPQKWPDILDYHNDAIKKTTSPTEKKCLVPIRKPDYKIFVGQTLYIPTASKSEKSTLRGMNEPTANKKGPSDRKTSLMSHLGKGLASIFEMKTNYEVDLLRYTLSNPKFKIEVTLKGNFEIENISQSKSKNNLIEFLWAYCYTKEAWNKLKETVTVKFDLDLDEVTLEAPFIVGGIDRKLIVKGPNWWQVELKPKLPQGFEGKISTGNREFRFNVKISLIVIDIKRKKKAKQSKGKETVPLGDSKIKQITQFPVYQIPRLINNNSPCRIGN